MPALRNLALIIDIQNGAAVRKLNQTATASDRVRNKFDAVDKQVKRNTATMQTAAGATHKLSIAQRATAYTSGVMHRAHTRMSGAIHNIRTRISGLTSRFMENKMAVMALSAAMIAAATIAIKKFVNAAAELETVLYRIQARTGRTGEDFRGLAATVRDVAKANSDSFDTIGSVLTKVTTRFQITGEEANTATQAVLDLSKVTGGDAVRNADLLTRMMKTYNLSASETYKLTDLLIAAHQEYGLNIAETLPLMKSYSGVFKSLGLNISDAIGFMGAIEVSGYRGTSVMMGLRQSIEKFKTPEEFWKTLDMLAAMEDKTLQGKKAAELFGKTAGPAMVALLAHGTDGLKQYFLATDEVAGATKEASALIDETFNEQLGILKNNLRLVSAEMGVILLPILKGVCAIIKKFADVILSLPKPTKKVLSGIALLALGLIGLKGAMLGASLASGILGGSLMASLAPFLPIILGVGAAIAVFSIIWKKNLWGIQEATEKVFGGLKKIFMVLAKAFKAIFTGFAAIFYLLFKPLLQFFGLMKKGSEKSTFLVTVVDAISSAFSRLYTWLEPHLPLINKILKVIGIFAAGLFLLFTPIGHVILAITLLSRALLFLKRHTEGIRGAFGGIINKLKYLKYALFPLIAPIMLIYKTFKNWDKIKDSAGGILDKLKPLKSFLPLLLASIGAIWLVFKNWGKVKGIVTGLGSTLKAKLGTALETVREGATKATTKLTEVFAKLKMGKVVLDIATKVRTGDITGALKTLIKLPRAYIGDIYNAFTKITDKIGEVFGISNISAKIEDWGTGILEGIRSKFSDISGAIREGGRRVEKLLAKTESYKAVVDIIAKLRTGDFIGVLKGIPDLVRAYSHDTFRAFENIINRIGNAFGIANLGTQITEGIRGGFNKVFGFLTSLPTHFYEAGTKLIEAFVDGIKSVAAAPIEAVKNIGKQIRDFLPFSNAKKGALATLTESGAKLPETFARGMIEREGAIRASTEHLMRAVQMRGIEAKIDFAIGKVEKIPIVGDIIKKIHYNIGNIAHAPLVENITAKINYVQGEIAKYVHEPIKESIQLVYKKVTRPILEPLQQGVNLIYKKVKPLVPEPITQRINFLYNKIVPQINKPAFDKRYYEEGSIRAKFAEPKIIEPKIAEPKMPFIDDIISRIHFVVDKIGGLPILGDITKKIHYKLAEIPKAPIFGNIERKISYTLGEVTESPVFEDIIKKVHYIHGKIAKTPIFEDIIAKIHYTVGNIAHAPLVENTIAKINYVQGKAEKYIPESVKHVIMPMYGKIKNLPELTIQKLSVIPQLLKPEYNRKYYEEGSIRLRMNIPELKPEVKEPKMPIFTDITKKLKYIIEVPKLPIFKDIITSVSYKLATIPRLPIFKDITSKVHYIVGRIMDVPPFNDITRKVSYILGKVPKTPIFSDITKKVHWLQGKIAKVPIIGDILRKINYTSGRIEKPKLLELTEKVNRIYEEPLSIIPSAIQYVNFKYDAIKPRVEAPSLDTRFYETGSIRPVFDIPEIIPEFGEPTIPKLGITTREGRGGEEGKIINLTVNFNPQITIPGIEIRNAGDIEKIAETLKYRLREEFSEYTIKEIERILKNA